MDISEARIPVPQEVVEKYILWLIATSADKKLTGLLYALLWEDLLFFAVNAEKSGIFKEPDDPDVQKVAWYKAVMLQYILRFFGRDVLEEVHVPLTDDPENSIEIKNGEQKPDKAVAVAMDVSTTVARTREDLDNPKKAIEFLKLSRKLEGITDPDEIIRIIEKDREEHRELFSNEHWVRFRVGVAAVSSDKTISNSTGVEIIVQINGYSDKIIDEGYQNPRLSFIGPRLNEAQLIEDHPERVRFVEISTLSKSEKKKRVILQPDQYYLVRQAVVHGVLPENVYKNLFKERPGELKLHKTRPII